MNSGRTRILSSFCSGLDELDEELSDELSDELERLDLDLDLYKTYSLAPSIVFCRISRMALLIDHDLPQSFLILRSFVLGMPYLSISNVYYYVF